MALAMRHGFNPAIKHLYRHSEAKHGYEERGAFLLRLIVCWYSGENGLILNYSESRPHFDKTGLKRTPSRID
jgi:hypothetical protein